MPYGRHVDRGPSLVRPLFFSNWEDKVPVPDGHRPHPYIYRLCLSSTTYRDPQANRKSCPQKLSENPTNKNHFKMYARDLDMVVMGRGAYDTTGVPKPPPRPSPK